MLSDLMVAFYVEMPVKMVFVKIDVDFTLSYFLSILIKSNWYVEMGID